tara:strand:+ start:71461 stop:71808 length:348 start_codon:yes stop_codon:yes gene_type:complete
MIVGTKFEQGEIVLVPFPFSDLSGVKQRPVLVLSKRSYNKETNDIITCGITSNVKEERHSVYINDRSLSDGELPFTSRIKVDKLFTLEQAIIRKSLGKVNKETMSVVKEKFVNLI